MTHPFTRLAEELTDRYSGTQTILTAEALVSALSNAVAHEKAELFAKQDRVSSEQLPEEYAFPPTPDSGFIQASPKLASVAAYLDAVYTEPELGRAEEPVEERIARAYSNGLTEGIRIGRQGKFDR